MLLPFPTRFDSNEWFVLTVMTGAIVLCASLRKVIPLPIAVAVYLFTVCAGTWIDYVIGLHFQMYRALDTFKHEWFDVFCLDVSYPLIGYLFAYFLVRLGIQGRWVLLYILIATALTTFSEWISAMFHVFVYYEWKILYSFIVYAILYVSLYSFYRVVVRCAASKRSQQR